MQRETVIQKFCDAVNDGLTHGENRASHIYDILKSDIGDDKELLELLDELQENFGLAYQPQHFFDEKILEAGIKLDQCYELLSQIFGADVLDPKSLFVNSLTQQQLGQKPETYLMMGRFFSVSGVQHYSDDGHLIHFEYDPLSVTSGVVSVCNGDYMSLGDGNGMGTIGQAAARAGMRGQGHGKLIVEEFERQMYQLAHLHGEKLIMMALEAEARATQFWSSRGYRWVLDSFYIQPPIDYDETTGEPLYEAVKGELLMIKQLDNPLATHIDRQLLGQVLRVMYTNWYLPDYIPQEAQIRVKEQVLGDFYKQFMASLSPGDAPVALTIPPHD